MTVTYVQARDAAVTEINELLDYQGPNGPANPGIVLPLDVVRALIDATNLHLGDIRAPEVRARITVEFWDQNMNYAMEPIWVGGSADPDTDEGRAVAKAVAMHNARRKQGS